MRIPVIRMGLMTCSAMTAVALIAPPAMAQDDKSGLEEIVVTAQKREQSVQDVPIAVTALSGDALAANRVTDVTDLTSLPCESWAQAERWLGL